MRHLLNHGELLVVETDDDAWLGTVEVVDGAFVVRSGYVGRPVVLDADDVVSVHPLGAWHLDAADTADEGAGA